MNLDENDNEELEEEIEENDPPIIISFAPTWKRVVSYIIDMAILITIISFLLSIILENNIAPLEVPNTPEEQIKFINTFIMSILDKYQLQMSLFNFIAQCAYFTLFWAGSGQTIGGRIMNIAVMGLPDRKITVIQGIARYSIISLTSVLLYIPMIFVVNRQYNQRLHDFFTRSVVIEIPKEIKQKKKE